MSQHSLQAPEGYEFRVKPYDVFGTQALRVELRKVHKFLRWTWTSNAGDVWSTPELLEVEGFHAVRESLKTVLLNRHAQATRTIPPEVFEP
jgi:hypothetical protein